MTPLFPDIIRFDDGPARWGDRHYDYLQRTAQADFSRIRGTLEEWFGHYPKRLQKELRNRIQSRDDRHFRSAFFELYLHELLVRLGYDLIVHPETQARPKTTPDFLVRGRETPNFFLEASEASERTDEEAAAESRVNQVYDCINELSSPDFFIGVEVVGSPRTTPPGSRFRRFLETKLASLSSRDFGPSCGLDELPRWKMSHEDWDVRFFPIPKPISSRGVPGLRPLALVIPGDLARVEPEAGIRKKVLGKRKHLGRLEHPLVVAINAMDPWADREASFKALFGDPSSVMVTPGPDGQPIESPYPNGVWLGPKGPRRPEVAAVVVGLSILPWTIGTHDLCLYRNPWASSPVGGGITMLPSLTLDGGKVVERPGTPAGELLGLPGGWPFDEDE